MDFFYFRDSPADKFDFRIINFNCANRAAYLKI